MSNKLPNHCKENMQLLQARFDQSRGFQQLPFSTGSLDGQNPISFQDRLSMAEFAAIGLGGEVGEILNGLKKVRRDVALKGIETNNEKHLQEEIADVYSYLLKLSNVLGYDLDIAYMEKVCLNLQRFPPLKTGSRPVVIVAGPPGSGKSSATSGLLKTPGRVAYVENFSQNPFLEEAILRGESAFESQEWFIDQLRRFLDQPVSDEFITVIDQTPLAIPLVYGRDFYVSNKLTKQDYLSHLKNYFGLQEQLEGLTSTVFNVYLTADFNTLNNRCLTKGFVDREWLARIVDRFEPIGELADVCIDTTELSIDDVVLKISSMIISRG